MEEYADAAAEAACHLAEAAPAAGWSAAAVADATDAIDYLVEALSTLGPHAARLLAPIPAATANLLHHLDHVPPGPPAERAVSDRPERRPLGPGPERNTVTAE